MPIVRDGSASSRPRGADYEVVAIAASATLDESHGNRLLRVSSGSGVTLTLPRTLPAGFHCMVEQYGAGQVTVAVAAGATLNNSLAAATTLAQYSVVHIVCSANATGISAIYNLSGERTTAVTATAAELNMLDNAVASVTWVVSAGTTNICIMTGTLKDAAGATIAASRPLDIYISTAATGIGVSGTSYSTGAAITTGTVVVAFTANKVWRINTHTDGTFAISITASGKPATEYGVAIIGTKGTLSVSAASGILWGA